MYFTNGIILLILGATLTQYSLALTTTDLGDGIVHTLDATADVFLYDGTNQNYHDFLIVGFHPGYPLKRTLIKFEDIPSSCKVIKSAKMYLWYWYSHKASFQTVQQVPFIPRPLAVHQVKKSWIETQATKTNGQNGIAWSSPNLGPTSGGIKVDKSDVKKRPVDTVTMYAGRPAGYVEFDVTKAARNWLSGQDNNGVLIYATNEDVPGREVRFYSRERSTNRPRMTVICDYN